MTQASRRERIEAMLADEPDDVFLRYSLAMELDKESRHDESLQRLSDLRADATPYIPAFFMAGQQLARLDRNDEAQAVLRDGIEEAQNQGDGHAAGEMREFLASLGRLVVLFMALVGSLACSVANAADAGVLPEGQRPKDRRLEPLKDYDGHFPFTVPATIEAWEARAKALRRRVKVAAGVWPMPEKTPLNAVIHGRVEREGFTVEKVYFESMPNHFVTGLLFRPKDRKGKRPGVLCPHGHGGRLQDYGEKKTRELIAQGAERFEDCGRYPKLSRCVQLARMGCVSFIFDMVGYADSVQISDSLAHRYSKQRPSFEGRDRWGFFSTHAELRMQTIMGLHVWNALRALDFLCSLPDVDPARIGVTGGSGGGTQTIMIGAIDPRPIVTFPQGMVSTSMQGGCVCENCSLLRVGTGNVELAALFAPKPTAMTTANDWTRAMMTDGYPQLKQLYTMLGVPDNVECADQRQFPHNYNYVTRARMYHWFNRHLKLGLPEPIVEERWKPLTPEEWTVWDAEHPRPPKEPDYERTLLRAWADRSDRQLAALTPKDPKSLAAWRAVVGPAFETILGRTLDEVGPIERQEIATQDHGSFRIVKELVRAKSHGEEIPVLSLVPTKADARGPCVIWVDGDGKSALFDRKGNPTQAVRRLLDSGATVVSADLFQQGEFLPSSDTNVRNRLVPNPREYAGYTYAYNPTLFAQRVHDILTLVAAARSGPSPARRVHVLGTHGAGPLVAAARAIAGSAIDRAAVDTGGFRFTDLTSFQEARFVPGAVKYGDLPALLALSAPHPLWIGGEIGAIPPLTAAAYRASPSPSSVTVSDNPDWVDESGAAITWLLERQAAR